jgi:hypothetical protein
MCKKGIRPQTEPLLATNRYSKGIGYRTDALHEAEMSRLAGPSRITWRRNSDAIQRTEQERAYYEHLRAEVRG